MISHDMSTQTDMITDSQQQGHDEGWHSGMGILMTRGVPAEGGITTHYMIRMRCFAFMQ